MKYRLSSTRTALTACTVALGSTLALAQAQDSEPADASSAMTWPGGAGSLEQFANARPDALEGQEIVNTSNERIGTIDEVVRKTEDSEIYALISAEDASKSAVRLSELRVGALAYDGSRQDLQQDAYADGGYVRISADVPNVDVDIAGAAADERTPGAIIEDAEPGLAIDQSFVEQLATNASYKLEGTPLIGNDGDEIGEIDHIARKMPDGALFAVITAADAGERSVVDLAELSLGHISYDGSADDLRDANFDSDDYQPVTIPQ